MPRIIKKRSSQTLLRKLSLKTLFYKFQKIALLSCDVLQILIFVLQK